MREAIGGTWLLGLVLTFIVFFASFLAVSINYSKAFGVKNNIVDLISKYEGNNCNARKKVGSYLQTVGYLVPGKCPDDEVYNGKHIEYIGFDLDGNKTSGSSKSYYCISKDTADEGVVLDKKFYRVVVFFKIDLPMVGNITTFKIRGETESIPFAKDPETTSSERYTCS